MAVGHNFQLQPRDLDILRSLFESRIMTAAHLSHIHFESRSEATKKRLQILKSAGLVGERPRRVSDPSILFLTTKAFQLLKAEGILGEYPHFDLPSLEKRARVSEITIRHELEVQDVKASFHRALRSKAQFQIEEFVTWPALYEFEARNSFGREVPVKPDGFIRIHEKEQGTKGYEHAFFIEVDRSSEILDTLANRAASYLDYYKSGGFAVWMGGTRYDPKEYPFRVLMIFKTAERRNNIAERLLQINPPIYTQVCLSTLEEVKADPLGLIWIRPVEYREAAKGTQFDLDRQSRTPKYIRNSERERTIQPRLKFQRILT